MPEDWYKWSEFCELSRAFMPLEKQRLALQDSNGTPGYISNQIRQAVIDLQKYIPAFLKNHETIYDPEDFATDGSASVGTAPPSAAVKEFWVCNTETGARYPTTMFPYARRYELIHGTLEIPDQHARVAMASGGRFWVYPVIQPGFCLVIKWDGIGTTNVKLDFKDDELVPFTEDAAKAVAHFVKAEVCREIDKDYTGYDSHLRSYLTARKDIYLNNKEKQPIT
jgi:hypothetical protein